MITRRGLFLGAASILAAPSIVRAASLMSVRVPFITYFAAYRVRMPGSWIISYTADDPREAHRRAVQMITQAEPWVDGIQEFSRRVEVPQYNTHIDHDMSWSARGWGPVPE